MRENRVGEKMPWEDTWKSNTWYLEARIIMPPVFQLPELVELVLKIEYSERKDQSAL